MFDTIDRTTEETVIEAVDRERLVDHVDALDGLSRHSGSRDERAGTDYVADRLREYGVDVEYADYEAYVSDPEDATMQVTAPKRWRVPDEEVITVAFGAATSPAGVHGEVVALLDASEATVAAHDVAGRLVLVSGLPRAGPVKRLAKAGAAAAIFESPTEGHCHEMIVTPVWGTPGIEDEDRIPDLPVIEVSQNVANRLRDALDRGPLAATVETAVTTDCYTLPGRESDRYFLIGNHVDSWYEGVTDNATAVAASLELARVFAAHDEPPRRGLVFGFWTAHSFGRYAGSTWFADTHFADLRENGLAYIHLDLNGLKGADTLWYQHMAAAEDEHLDVLSSVPDLELPNRSGASSFLGAERPGRNSDQSFWGTGLVSLLSGARLPPETPEGGPVGGGWWWHTPEDTRDKVDPDVLVEETQAYAALATRICESPIVPFDHTASARALVDCLDDAGFDHDALADLRDRAEDLERAVAEANRVFDARADEPAVARAAEDLQVRLANRLIPALYTARPDHLHDRALTQDRLPGIDAIGVPDRTTDRNYLFAETSLRRETNRLDDLLRDAQRSTRRFLDQYGEATGE